MIVATQMLHTMINNPRPTRAEVTDIANAIYYRTDALMLSGETAYGKYPVEAVKTMAKIAAQAEKDKLAENDIRIPLDENSNDVTAFLAKQAVKATSKLNIRAIITDSFSGRTARNIAAFRGKYPVLAICYKEKRCVIWLCHMGWRLSICPKRLTDRHIISLLCVNCWMMVS